LRAAEVMAATIPHAEKVIAPNCAHLPNMEQPTEFNRVALDFLRRQA
jgi:pimeloyl-ACP methyl ester carboxylesterase